MPDLPLGSPTSDPFPLDPSLDPALNPVLSYVAPDDLGPGRRWSTWDDVGVLAGPEPWPDWVVTSDAAVDTELGVLKTGKEADVFLLERADADAAVVLAAKRYRSLDHRLFSRDAGYTEGRRMRNSRDRRAAATAGRSAPGSGPPRSSTTWRVSGPRGCPCRTPCSWTGPSC